MSAAKDATPGQVFTDLDTGNVWILTKRVGAHPWSVYIEGHYAGSRTWAEAEAARLALLVPQWSEALKTRFHGKPHLTIADLTFEAPVTDTLPLDGMHAQTFSEHPSEPRDRDQSVDGIPVVEFQRPVAPTLDVNNLQTILRHAARAVCLRGHDPSNLNTVMDVADYLTDTADRIEAEGADWNQRDPWNPNSADLRFAADVLHGYVGEIEASVDGMPTSDPASQCIEQLRYDADEMDAKEIARNVFPHLDATELVSVTEVFLNTIRGERERREMES